MTRTSRGFTLVETIVVLVVIAVLSGLSYISYSAFQHTSRVKALSATAYSVDRATAARAQEAFTAPSTEDAILTLDTELSTHSVANTHNYQWESNKGYVVAHDTTAQDGFTFTKEGVSVCYKPTADPRSTPSTSRVTEGVCAPDPVLPAMSPVVTPGNRSLAVSWTASPSAVDRYVVTASVDGSIAATCDSAGTGCTLTGLTNGISYEVSVTGTHMSAAAGEVSSAATTVFAAPSDPAVTPTAPVLVSAAQTSTTVTLTWNAPATGTQPITYTATAGSQHCTTTDTTCTITGLTTTTLYTTTVTATNSAGTSPASSPLPVYTGSPSGSWYNLTSMCKLSANQAQFRVRNFSGTPRAYTLVQFGHPSNTFTGTAAGGDQLVAVPWAASNDTWILTIGGYTYTKAVGNNQMCG